MPNLARIALIDDYVNDLLAPAPPPAAAVAPAQVAPPPPPAAAVAPAQVAPPPPPDVPQPAPRVPEPVKGEVAPERRRASDRSERWIGFTVAGQSFGVEVLQVIEVQTLCEITPVPGASAELLGAINLRGQIVSVLDLARRLGFGVTENTPATRLIVVDYRGQPVGLRVDGVSEVITAMASTIEATPVLGGRIAAGWVRGVLRHKHETVLLLDPVKLLADVEA